jgi:hypothetical protein
MRATLPSQSTFCVLSSGRAVAQSMMALIPTRVAGRDVGSVKSACRTNKRIHVHMGFAQWTTRHSTLRLHAGQGATVDRATLIADTASRPANWQIVRQPTMWQPGLAIDEHNCWSIQTLYLHTELMVTAVHLLSTHAPHPTLSTDL